MSISSDVDHGKVGSSRSPILRFRGCTSIEPSDRGTRLQALSPIACLIIGVTVVTLFLVGWAHDFILCDMECGETLLAIRAAEQFETFGVRYALLEILGPDTAPVVYTHSVNLGTLTFVALSALGIKSLALKILLPLTAFGVGLYYVFLTVWQVSRSKLTALIVLAIFATTYWGLGAFALNALRAWHMLGLFAILFHVHKLSEIPGRLPDLIGLVFGALVAFGCGYDFWIICGCVGATQIIARTSQSWRSKIILFFWLAGAFALPLILRQIQIIWALGLDFWARDLLFSLAIKIPYADNLIAIPPLPEIDAWYRAHHVLRPPAIPANSFSEILFTFRHMITSVTLPRWGILTLLTLPLVIAWPFLKCPRNLSIDRISLNLLLPLVIGAATGLAILAPFSMHVYFKHEFPLVAFPLLLAKGVVIAFLLDCALADKARLAALLMLGLYVFDAVMVHLNNDAHGPMNNFEWTRFVRARPAAEFILATYDPKLSRRLPSLDGADVTFIPPEGVFASLSSPPSGKERYLVYQPIEQFVDFDAKVPNCAWRDWISNALRKPQPLIAGRSCIYKIPLPPNAKPQPSLEDIARLAPVVELSKKGVGYVIVRLP
jgi:hypothetical protein